MKSVRPDGCIETAAICRIADVPKSTLDYWVRSGLVTPTVRTAPGHRVSRLWRVEDAVLARAIKVLRDSGCPMRVLKKARSTLDAEWTPLLGSNHLVWDGSDLFRVCDWDTAESVVKNPGQRTFRMVTLPVDAWAQEMLAEVVALPSHNRTAQRKAS